MLQHQQQGWAESFIEIIESDYLPTTSSINQSINQSVRNLLVVRVTKINPGSTNYSPLLQYYVGKRDRQQKKRFHFQSLTGDRQIRS